MASHTTNFYDIALHKPIVQRILSHLSNKDAFSLFAVSSALRGLWYIQYKKMGNSKPFEMRANEIKLAREWRKALDIEKRLFEMTGQVFDMFKCDPMEKFRWFVKKHEGEVNIIKLRLKREREEYMQVVWSGAKKMIKSQN